MRKLGVMPGMMAPRFREGDSRRGAKMAGKRAKVTAEEAQRWQGNQAHSFAFPHLPSLSCTTLPSRTPLLVIPALDAGTQSFGCNILDCHT